MYVGGTVVLQAEVAERDARDTAALARSTNTAARLMLFTLELKNTNYVPCFEAVSDKKLVSLQTQQPFRKKSSLSETRLTKHPRRKDDRKSATYADEDQIPACWSKF